MFCQKNISYGTLAVVSLAIGSFSFGAAARADNMPISSYALEKAMGASDNVSLYTPRDNTGFNINSSYYEGYASGVTPPESDADFNDDQRLYALLVDGRYDFNHDNAAMGAPVHPYLSGGMGMASTSVGANLTSAGAPAVPLFRLGGGVAYRMGEQWNMSLDYTAGYAAYSSEDQVFTGRGNQPVDLQTLNVGVHYDF